MQFPEFFDRVPRLQVRDPLASFLGASEGGVMEYGYADAVRLAGHSCPTVASAYRITGLAMERLYRDAVPERGGIRVEFRQSREEGVTGVVAAIATLLTGAAGEEGFPGVGGQFGRRGLLLFGRPVPMDFRFVREDNGAWVDCAVDLRHVPADPALPLLMQKCLHGRGPTTTACLANCGRTACAACFSSIGTTGASSSSPEFGSSRRESAGSCRQRRGAADPPRQLLSSTP